MNWAHRQVSVPAGMCDVVACLLGVNKPTAVGKGHATVLCADVGKRLGIVTLLVVKVSDFYSSKCVANLSSAHIGNFTLDKGFPVLI